MASITSATPANSFSIRPTNTQRASGVARDLLDVGALLSRPGAGRVSEGRARFVVERRARSLEDRALQGGRGHDLGHRRVAVRRLRRLAVVDDPPRLLEQLLRYEAADEAAG